MKFLTQAHRWLEKERGHVAFTLLAFAAFASSFTHAQSQSAPYTLRERASTNQMSLFRTDSEMTKTHGVFLDDKHRVKIYEDDGWVVLSLQKKQRAPGGPDVAYGMENDDDIGSTIRYDEEYDLIRLGAEVLAPAPPNYIRNPGRRYRVFIEGLAVAPLYKNQFEVDAANALDAISTEIHKLSAQAKDLEVPAIEFGGMVALRALNESGFLPTRIPLTVLRSKVGQVRIQGQYFERGGKLLRLPRFGNLASGQQTFNYEMPKMSNPLRQSPKSVHGPTYRRGQGESQVEPLRVQLRPYQPEKSLMPKDVRANQFADLGSQDKARERFVQRGRSLTEPDDKRESALDRAQRGTSELLSGSKFTSPLEAKANSADEAGIQTGVSYSPSRRSGIARAGFRR